MIKKIKYWLRSFRKIKTAEQAIKMNLIHVTNVHGDLIIAANCRSMWVDEFSNYYKCDELLGNEIDLVMEEIFAKHPEFRTKRNK